MALLMLERRSVNEAPAPAAWCETHNSRLRVLAVESATVEYQCPVGAERYTDRIEQVHVIEERWLREEVHDMDEQTSGKPDSAGDPKPAPETRR